MSLKTIYFDGEMLPSQASQLDFAAQICPVCNNTRGWFFRFVKCSGVDDHRMVIERCGELKEAIIQNKKMVIKELIQFSQDDQASDIFNAWLYSLETMIDTAQIGTPCRWVVEGGDDVSENAGGDVTLRRV